MADEAQIRHLLRRTEFVDRQSRVDALTPLSRTAAIDNILDVGGPVALPAYIDHNNPDNMGLPSNWDQYVYATKWWFDRMAFDSPKPIQEKMAFFWHGHFTSDWGKIYNTWQMMTQNKLYRDNALGNFQTLSQAMALQPAMLVYLDNADNTKSSPNQNFARELMELFLLGVGNYAESDVEASSLAWTGHTVNAAGQYVFVSNKHSVADKTFFGTTKNWNGPDIITEILTGAKKQISARYIVGKLWDYFAAPGTQPAALATIATAFSATFDIKAALKSMFDLEEFYSTSVKQGLVRTPVDWVVAVMVSTGYRAAVLNPQWFMDGMGQTPFRPPNVSGWRPNAAWINTSSMGTRAEFARNATWSLRKLAADRPENALRGDMSSLGTATIPQAISAVSALFGLSSPTSPLSATTNTAFTNYLTIQRASQRWTDWWEPTNLLTMAMLAPEMHLA
jgi:uncharacterized protein (DUF1800 family)